SLCPCGFDAVLSSKHLVLSEPSFSIPDQFWPEGVGVGVGSGVGTGVGSGRLPGSGLGTPGGTNSFNEPSPVVAVLAISYQSWLAVFDLHSLRATGINGCKRPMKLSMHSELFTLLS